MANTPKETPPPPQEKTISEYSFEELKTLLESKKVAELNRLQEEINAARLRVTTLEVQIEQITGVPLNPPPSPSKRGRKPGSKNSFPFGGRSPGKPARNGDGGKMTAKAGILHYLEKHGPSSSKEIIAGTKMNAGSINQALVLLKKDKSVKHDGKRGGKYSSAK